MINIGRRPTLDNGDNVSIEAHLFDFTGNLYEKEITLSFVEKMREEMKFADISALVDQLNCDAAAARRILFL
jgi:riboflavin kinase/FMN adenylyltransferase